jgi:hypothetical protein
MGASSWSYFVPYQPDVNAALRQLRQSVFEQGDYWWAVKGEFGPASAYPDRPTRMDDLLADELVQECGTHSILDMEHVLAEGEEPYDGAVLPVTAAEARAAAGTEVLTREHVQAIDGLANRWWVGRCAVLHDEYGNPTELYFWGFSGD